MMATTTSVATMPHSADPSPPSGSAPNSNSIQLGQPAVKTARTAAKPARAHSAQNRSRTFRIAKGLYGSIRRPQSRQGDTNTCNRYFNWDGGTISRGWLEGGERERPQTCCLTMRIEGFGERQPSGNIFLAS